MGGMPRTQLLFFLSSGYFRTFCELLSIFSPLRCLSGTSVEPQVLAYRLFRAALRGPRPAHVIQNRERYANAVL